MAVSDGSHSKYPKQLDALRRLVEGRDRPSAAFWNVLFEAAIQVQKTIGADFANFHSSFPSGASYTDLQGLLQDLARCEWGTFKVDKPYPSPTPIGLAHPERFTDIDKFRVRLMHDSGSRSTVIDYEAKYSVVPFGDGGSPTEKPLGFDLFQNPIDRNATWIYWAWEDPFN